MNNDNTTTFNFDIDYSKIEIKLFKHVDCFWPYFLGNNKRPHNKGQRKYRAKKGWRRYK